MADRRFFNDFSLRLAVLRLIALFLVLLIGGRLIQLQILEHDQYLALAKSQYNSKIKLPAKRGEILIHSYRSKQILPIATDTSLDLVYLDPAVIDEPERVAEELSRILKLDREEIYAKAITKEQNSVLLAKDLEADVITQIESYNFRGIFVMDTERKATLASPGAIGPVAPKRKGDLYVDPTRLADHRLVLARLSAILAVEPATILPNFQRRKIRYVPLQHKLFPETSEEIIQAKLKGVVLLPEHWRFYPEGRLASNLMGFVNKEGAGQYGIEGQFDEQLHGADGKLLVDRDPFGREIAVGDKELVEPVNGNSFVLTLDRVIQRRVEEELNRTVDEFDAESGEIIVMEPATGKVLAMASYPGYDPNEFWKVYDQGPAGKYLNKVGPRAFYNPALALPYEPGSVFKVITLAAAIDAKEITPDTMYEDKGKLEIADFIIRNFDGRGRGRVNMRRVLEESLNTGAAFAAKEMGQPLFHSYIQNFGFGRETDIGLEIEHSGNFAPLNKWGKTAFITASFGQGFTATPIQMASAISAVVNDGKLMQPILIERVYNEHTGVEIKYEPKILRQVITKEAAQTMKGMMIGVVNGQAKLAKVPGYYVGGKSGTAQVSKQDAVGYEKDKFIASFAGFAPADDPRFVILVKIDYPKKDLYGVTVAAPAFSRLAEYILKYFEVEPNTLANK